VVAGEAEEEIQRALYVGNTSAAVDAALQARACRIVRDLTAAGQANPAPDPDLAAAFSRSPVPKLI